MPYRRLPNTDNARLRALRKALDKGKEIPPFKLAFSQSSYRKIQSVLPGFEQAIIEQRQSANLHAEKNKEFQKRIKKIKIYISHFIQVVNMAIARGELPPETLHDFGIDIDSKKVPLLNSDEEVIEWGKKLIDGEKNRISRGQNPITNPTIAVLKVHYDKFIDAHYNQKSLKLRILRAHDKLISIREEADLIIQQIWNEVEESYNDLPEEIRREKATDYGLVYVFRKSELAGITLLQSRRA
ncbi:MAG: hypothetical protein JXR52_04215 [Bacteroidales bacterium]|nr:hypothetical protein [Bacteroidales bacterium]MBN2698005.1 hypothetical protein [Bacteroidales bacterium]